MVLKKLMIILLALGALTACNNNVNEGAQPMIGEDASQVTIPEQPMNVSNTGTYDNPYNHNYNGAYSGRKYGNMTSDIRTAQKINSRVSETAEQIAGVERAVSIVQGVDIVVAIDTDNKGNRKALAQRVKQAITKTEPGYNVYVSTNADTNERIRTLFSNMINVKTSNVTPSIGEIIYQIGQDNG